MHRLTCNEADRLAADLDRAAYQLHHTAAIHARYADGLTIVGDHSAASIHDRWSADARDDARTLEGYALALRARTPLWPNGTGPSDRRARVTAKYRERRLTG